MLLRSLDCPQLPFFGSAKVALTVAHVGYVYRVVVISPCSVLNSSDTRVLLTATDGKVTPLTENHHADARVEAIRLRKMMGTGLITDSFGEAR